MGKAQNRLGTALYRFFDIEGSLIYVGISMNLPARFYQHERLSPWMTETSKITVTWYPTREAAMTAEFAAIETETPKYNQVGLVRHQTEESPQERKISQRKHQSLAAMEREIVQAVETLEVAQVYALYTLSAVARRLDLSIDNVRWLIEEKKLGHVVFRTQTGVERMRVTGWQFLDFLEWVQMNRGIP